MHKNMICIILNVTGILLSFLAMCIGKINTINMNQPITFNIESFYSMGGLFLFMFCSFFLGCNIGTIINERLKYERSKSF